MFVFGLIRYEGKEHWLGLRNIFELTNRDKYKLRITAEDQDDIKREYHYSTFKLKDKVKQRNIVYIYL